MTSDSYVFRANVIKVFLAVSIIVLLICVILFVSSETDYVIAKGNDTYFSYFGSASEAEFAKEDLSKIELLRTIYIIAGAISIVFICSCLYLIITLKSNNNGGRQQPELEITEKIKQLEKLRKENLITEDEFLIKKKDIINRL